MAIIKCNNPNFNDSRHNVLFKDGVARTDDEAAIKWFKANGYTVIEEKVKRKVKDDA